MAKTLLLLSLLQTGYTQTDLLINMSEHWMESHEPCRVEFTRERRGGNDCPVHPWSVGDFNNDGRTDMEDLAILSMKWPGHEPKASTLPRTTLSLIAAFGEIWMDSD